MNAKTMRLEIEKIIKKGVNRTMGDDAEGVALEFLHGAIAIAYGSLGSNGARDWLCEEINHCISVLQKAEKAARL